MSRRLGQGYGEKPAMLRPASRSAPSRRPRTGWAICGPGPGLALKRVPALVMLKPAVERVLTASRVAPAGL